MADELVGGGLEIVVGIGVWLIDWLVVGQFFAEDEVGWYE